MDRKRWGGVAAVVAVPPVVVPLAVGSVGRVAAVSTTSAATLVLRPGL